MLCKQNKTSLSKAKKPKQSEGLISITITDQEGAKQTACLLGKQYHIEQHQLSPSTQIIR